MKIKEYLTNLPVGEVVNKTALAYFKRMGFIFDYSQWGYLESLHIFGKREDGKYYANEFWLQISGNRACKGSKERDYSEMTFDDMCELFGPQFSFTWEGMTFRPKYFDGCFSPYLVKDGPANGKEVHHKIAFPCGVF